MDDEFVSTHEVTDPESWDLLKSKIAKKLDFGIKNYRDAFLKRRIEVRLRRLGLFSYLKYATIIENDDDEQKALWKELTIHVTHFFRDKSLYRELQDWIFPQLIKEKLERGSKTISIWSAGCSTGEEPYSIAIILREVLGDSLSDFKIDITASDIDESTISKAIMGVYEMGSFTELPINHKLEYFQRLEKDVYAISPIIKGMVKFEIADILKIDSFMKHDLIMCRNTVIYFEKQTKVELYESLYSKLKPGGFLVLGKSEFLDGSARTKFEVYNNAERIYRKPYDMHA